MDTVLKETAAMIRSEYTDEEILNMSNEQGEITIGAALTYIFDKYSKNSVWFTISNYRGKYFITMFYDNKYNEANGEDL